MRRLFYSSILALIIFEILRVYMIMPFPYSQGNVDVEIAYFLHSYRWVVRAILAAVMILVGIRAIAYSRWHLVALVPLVAVIFVTNRVFSAENMFREPNQVLMNYAGNNSVDLGKLVIGIVTNGEARAYPIQFIAYHHKLIDQTASVPVLVTYCTVCRTGRVFVPVVNGQNLTFRLVGMDRFNAMIEDSCTGTWWRQATGRAVAGELKGNELSEVQAVQSTLGAWLALHPDSLILQPDPAFQKEYAAYAFYENGQGGTLTGRDPQSWGEKSWIVGISVGNSSRAFDWNGLVRDGIVNDKVGEVPIVVGITKEQNAIFAFERPNGAAIFHIAENEIVSGDDHFDLAGRPVSGTGAPLKPVKAYQEFWHSWRTFHPDTATD